MLGFDIETDGLLDTLTKIHCIAIIDRDTGSEELYHNDPAITPKTGSVEDGVRRLMAADCIFGHNAIEFDVPAIQKLYPWFRPYRVMDTRVLSRLIYTNLAELDAEAIRKGKLPADFAKSASARGLSGVGSHSLKPWGVRLGFPKDDFDPADYGHTWATVPFMQSMADYCLQDVRVTVRLMEKMESKGYDARAVQLEHQVAEIIRRQQAHGWLFDVDAARRLTATLQVRRVELEAQARKAFAPFYVKDGQPLTPKRDNAKLGYTVGAAVQKLKLVEFNPASRDHVASRFICYYGWEPREFTPEGKPKVDETTLGGLPYPEAKIIAEFFRVEKQLGQLAEGDKAWLKMVRETGRIHGTVNTNGAVTGRMTHSHPNVAQADKDPTMRGLWICPPGYRLVGCDAEGLELRALGHYMARWDGGAFAHAVVEGKKELGTDAHTLNQKAAGFNKRDSAKTLIYALIYGAGDHKLGTIAYDDFTEEKRARFNQQYPLGSESRKAALTRLGKRLRQRMMEALPALARLTEACKKTAADRGYLIGLDGRHLHVRSQYKAVNTLLQSAGAVVMKQALVTLDTTLRDYGPTPGVDYEFVGNIHDEWQIEAKEENAEEIGRLAAASIRSAGEHFGLRCPLAGDYSVGTSWAETH